MKYRGFNINFYISNSISTYKGGDLEEGLAKVKRDIDVHIERIKNYVPKEIKTNILGHDLEVISLEKDIIKGEKIC